MEQDSASKAGLSESEIVFWQQQTQQSMQQHTQNLTGVASLKAPPQPPSSIADSTVDTILDSATGMGTYESPFLLGQEMASQHTQSTLCTTGLPRQKLFVSSPGHHAGTMGQSVIASLSPTTMMLKKMERNALRQSGSMKVINIETGQEEEQGSEKAQKRARRFYRELQANRLFAYNVTNGVMESMVEQGDVRTTPEVSTAVKKMFSLMPDTIASVKQRNREYNACRMGDRNNEDNGSNEEDRSDFDNDE